MGSPALTTESAYPLAIVQAVLAGLVVLLDLPPLIWHIKHRNFAPVVLIICILLLNLENVVNATAWPADNIPQWFTGAGLCDVEVKIIVASSTALPAATLCILKKLANVMDTKNMTVSFSKAQKRRIVIFEVLICLGIPILSMVFHFIVQPVRFILVGISGCTTALSSTWLSIAFVILPPLLITLVDAYYAALIACRLSKYRSRFDSILSASGTSKTRFLRLFLLSTTFVFAIFPVQLWLLLANWPSEIVPFAWSSVHGSWWSTYIPTLPSFGRVTPDHWIHLASGILVFIFFGLGREAKDMYLSWAAAIGLRKVFDLLNNQASHIFTGSTVSPGTLRKQDSSKEKMLEPETIFISPSPTSTIDIEAGAGSCASNVSSRANLCAEERVEASHGSGLSGWEKILGTLNRPVLGERTNASPC